MHRKAVMLVDDELPILYALGNYLERSDFYVKLARNGEAALAEFYSPTFFDLVITDLIMPGAINGLDILKEIKKTTSKTGVFILTGHGSTALASEELCSSADDIIFKPCDPDELISRMNRFFKKEIVRKNGKKQINLPILHNYRRQQF